jgi:hypothetical protein
MLINEKVLVIGKNTIIRNIIQPCVTYGLKIFGMCNLRIKRLQKISEKAINLSLKILLFVQPEL